jgi:hypothetical protein
VKNFWLEKYRIGRRVQYVGPDNDYAGRIGRIISISGSRVEVEFIFIGFIPTPRIFRTEKRYLKVL